MMQLEATTLGAWGGLPAAQDSLGGFMAATAARYPDRLCLRTATHQLTYAQVAVRAVAIADSLRSAGLGPGDVVACYLDDQIASAQLYLACAVTGIVPCPVSTVFSPRYFVGGVVEPAGAKAVITAPEVAAALDDCPVPVITTDELRLEIALSAVGAPAPKVAVERLSELAAGFGVNDTVILAPTSGSTGTPKLVRRRHYALVRYARYVGHQLATRSNEPHDFLLVASLNHAFGLHMLTTAWFHGAAVSVPSAIDTAADLGEIRELNPTVIPMVPRMQRAVFLQHRHRFGGKGPVFGDRAQFLCSAGGSPNYSILEKFREQGIEIVEFYGSTEASVVAVTPVSQWRQGWAGRIVPDADCILDPSGELLVRSPGVTPGYTSDVLNKEAFTEDGYYRTGDRADISDGYLRIKGRARDVFNTPEGSNIYPEWIEQKVEAVPSVGQAMLVGDGRPYLSAIVYRTELDMSGEDPLGFVSVEQAPSIYRALKQHLAELNQSLEKIEEIVRFAIVARPFPEGVYRQLPSSKVRRDRKAFGLSYKGLIDILYNNQPFMSDDTFVPGADRRLRPSFPVDRRRNSWRPPEL